MTGTQMILKISLCRKSLCTHCAGKFSQLLMHRLDVGVQVRAFGEGLRAQLALVIANLEVDLPVVAVQVPRLVEHPVAVFTFESFDSTMLGLKVTSQMGHLQKALRTLLE